MVDVPDPDVDVRLLRGHVVRDDLPERRAAIEVQRRRQAGVPGEIDQRSRLDVVVGMVVGDEDVADVGQGHVRPDQLLGHAITAVDHIGVVTADDDMRGHVARPADVRPAAGAEDDQLAGGRIRSRRQGAHGPRQHGKNRRRQHVSPRQAHQTVPPALGRPRALTLADDRPAARQAQGLGPLRATWMRQMRPSRRV